MEDEEEYTENNEDFYYQDNPVMVHYMLHLHQLIDNLHLETGDTADADTQRFKDVLMTVFRRIYFDGELEELDNILRLHFPFFYESDVKEDLINHPITGIN